MDGLNLQYVHVVTLDLPRPTTHRSPFPYPQPMKFHLVLRISLQKETKFTSFRVSCPSGTKTSVRLAFLIPGRRRYPCNSGSPRPDVT